MKAVIGICSQLQSGTPAPVLERLLSSTLTPLLQDMYRDGGICVSMTLSGFEMEWIEAAHPEINVLINILARRGQIDFLSTSFNGLALQLLPSAERAAEVEKTTTFIRRRYSRRPSGYWSYSQVWSPSSLSTIKLCTLEYAVISTSSASDDRLRGRKNPFVMSELGKSIIVIPTNDEISKLVSESRSIRRPTEVLCQLVQKARIERDAPLDYVMLNIDQLNYEQCNGYDVIMSAFERLRSRKLSASALDLSELRAEVLEGGYLAPGIYGYDFTPSHPSVNEIVLSNPTQRGFFRIMNRYWQYLKAWNADKSLKNEVASAIVRGMGAVDYLYPSVFARRNTMGKTLGEIDRLLETRSLRLPALIDLDDDGYDELIMQGEIFTAVFDTKGGGIDCFFNNLGLPDFRLPVQIPVFSDRIYGQEKGEIALNRQRFTMETDEKTYSTVTFSSGVLKKAGLDISVSKSFCFEGGSLNMEFTITNNADKPCGLRYEVLMPLRCKALSPVGTKAKTARFSIPDSDGEFTISVKAETKEFALDLLRSEKKGASVADGGKEDYNDGYRLQWDLKIASGSVFEQRLSFSC